MFYEISNAISKCYSSRTDTCGLKVNEGLIRTAISRAYYAVFFIAREALGLRNIRDPTVHARIIGGLHEDGFPDLANKIKYLRDKRNNADYSVYFSMSPKKIEWLIRLADNIIAEIQEKYSMPRPSSNSNYIQ